MNENVNNITLKDKTYAILSFIVSFILVEGIIMNGIGLFSTISLVLLYLYTTFYFIKKAEKISTQFVIVTAVEIAMAISFALFDNHFLKVMVFLMLIVIYPISVYFYDNKIKTADPVFFFSIIKSVFIAPFINFGKNIALIFKAKSKNKNVLFALLGLLISIPLIVILIALLVNADVVFENLFKGIIDYIVNNFFEIIFTIILSIPLSILIFSCLYSANAHSLDNILVEDTCFDVAKKIKKIPTITSLFVTVPVCIIYIIFFITQLSYFTSAFSGLLAEGYSYSEYARRGFFELLVIGVINLIIIAVISIFGSDKNRKINSIMSVILSVMSLIMIGISVSKMLLYIDAYGMTALRIYTMWFLAFLTIVFIIVILKQFKKNIGVFITVCVLAVATLLGCIYSNPDAMIAKYNVNAYLNGKTKEMDIYALYELDSSAIKYVMPLTECDDEEVARQANDYIDSKRRELLNDNKNWDNNITHKKEASSLNANAKTTLFLETYIFDDVKIYGISCTIVDEYGNSLATVGTSSDNGEMLNTDESLYFEFYKFDLGDIDNCYIVVDFLDENQNVIQTAENRDIELCYGNPTTVYLMQNEFGELEIQ